jgi:PGF-pre-PGF domain-containing protein
MIVCQLIIEVPDILGLRVGLRTMKMKVYFLNSIISIFLITLIIPGVISCIASAGDGDYISSSNNSEIAYNDSEEFNYSNYEEFNYSNYEEFNYSNYEEFNYSNYEEYLNDDGIYTYYDSSISDLDVVRDLYWMGIDVIEPEANIYTKELVTRNIMGGFPVRFDFGENATLITYINFDPIKTFRKTITTAEVLKDVSVFIPKLPIGRIYQYTNIFVGKKGAGLPTSLKNGLVGFRVEKTWIKDNDVNESMITLQRYNNTWEPLYTEKVGEDNNFIYFQSKTPGFSFFAITEYGGKSDKNNTEEYLNYTEEPDENYTEEANENYTEEADENYTEEPDENYTEEADENYTEPDENYTGKADLNYTEPDENCTGKADLNYT